VRGSAWDRSRTTDPAATTQSRMSQPHTHAHCHTATHTHTHTHTHSQGSLCGFRCAPQTTRIFVQRTIKQGCGVDYRAPLYQCHVHVNSYPASLNNSIQYTTKYSSHPMEEPTEPNNQGNSTASTNNSTVAATTPPQRPQMKIEINAAHGLHMITFKDTPFSSPKKSS
jgi:hypothetical protein